MPCKLDDLTWEIFHMIFGYLKTTDLLKAFVKISPHVDTIVHLYPRIQLDFKSIKKSTFYFICENVHPDQVQSLVLSDDEYTPGQMKLFMSFLPLIKFVNLQHINIHQIHDVDLLCLIISHLKNNVRLRSLSVNSESTAINKKTSRRITETLVTLPSLKQLTFINSSALITLGQPLPKLTHLTIYSCNLKDLRIIFQWVPNLVYLKISVPYSDDTLTFDYVSPHLTSLIIESQCSALFDELEKFFSLTPSLKRLTLETVGEQALLDGRRWKTLIKTKLPYLIEFALNITPEPNAITASSVLMHFRDSFWTTEKHWHMACLISSMSQSCVRLFSVTHFSPAESWYPASEDFVNYSWNHYLYHDDRTDLRVSHFPSQVTLRSSVKHIRTLSLEYTTVTVNQLQGIANLLSISHLKVGPFVQCTSFNGLLKSASNIYQLTLGRKKTVDSLSDGRNVYEQIKKLNVEDTVLSNDIDKICQTFPKLEHVSLTVKEKEDILLIFKGLHYLTSATLGWTDPSNTSPQLIDEYLKQNGICTDDTYRCHASSLHVWVD